VKKVKILITGATGFIGSHLTESLLKDGNEIKVIIRKTSNLQWLKNLPIEYVNVSLNDEKTLESVVENVDYIYHVAGLVAAKTYDEFLKANRDTTFNLLQACVNKNPNLKRFLLVSSQTVAGPSKSLNSPKTEADTPEPITKYGKSKYEGEKVAYQFMDKLPITIVRPPAVYGPRDPAIKDIFKIANKGLATLIGFNKKYVSLIHSSDLVRGIKLAALSDNSVNQIYFITSNQFYTWDEIMDVMKFALNKKSIIKLRLPHSLVLSLGAVSGFLGKFSKHPPVFDYEKSIDFIQNYWICSPEKAKNELGFVSEIDLIEGISNTANWYKEHNWI
jgi:nucleoside-diphosphate-sugar epimerase